MEYNATVIAREEISPGNIVLRVRTDGDLFDFEAGQFAVLGLKPEAPRVEHAGLDPEGEPLGKPGKLVRRAYSIASSSKEHEYVEFYVTLVPSGELTPRLFALAIGSRLFLSTKATGLFTLDRVPDEQNVLFLSTGTGLAPYMSMLRTHLLCGGDRKFGVLHGARVSWDLGYRAELESLDRLCGNFTYIPAITRPEEDPSFQGATGRLQTHLESDILVKKAGLHLDPERTHVFVCGNPGMIEASSAWLTEHGFQADAPRAPGNLHTEKYW